MVPIEITPDNNVVFGGAELFQFFFCAVPFGAVDGEDVNATVFGIVDGDTNGFCVRCVF